MISRVRIRSSLLALIPLGFGCGAPQVQPIDASWTSRMETNLKTTVEKLVSFGTRHSLSTKGIGEAGAWLKGEFEKIGGLKVEYHEFTDPKLKRGDELVTVRNVIATLRGKTRPDEV